MMRWFLVVLLLVHGAIHVMGFVKAFDVADLPQLTQPISRGMGLAWASAALAVLATAALVVAGSRSWWGPGAAAAVMLSQVVIVSAWSDAKFWTIPNILLAGAALYGFASLGPLSLRPTGAVVWRNGVDATPVVDTAWRVPAAGSLASRHARRGTLASADR
jgi:hypothetical protein